jgi:hypothetical protein
MKVEDPFLAQFIINSLLDKFDAFHLHYNTVKEIWSVNELTNKLVQEAARIKQKDEADASSKNGGLSQAHHVHHESGRSKGKFKNRKGIKSSSSDKPSASGLKKEIKKQQNDRCHFCNKPGHFQADCAKRKSWFEKKGKPLALVCFESNYVEVPSNTWWLDSGSNVHVSNSMQGFLTTRTIKPNEASLYMGNKDKASVEAIGRFSLELSTGFKLNLEDTLYVPSLGRNLISVSKLDNDGFRLSFGQGCFSMFRDNIFVGSGILENGMYRIYLDKLFSESLCVSHNISLHDNVGSKRGRSSESSSFLWHKRLAHILRERMSILVKDNILPSLDFTDFGTCVECIKGKQTKHTKKGPQEALLF